MSKFNVPARDYMVSPVFTIRANARLSEAERVLSEAGISALPVVDVNEKLVGVISRTDLLRAGRTRIVANGGRKRALTLPEANVREFMNGTVECVRGDDPLSEIARRLVRMRIHRLYVAEDSKVDGVISTQEMMQAVADANVRLPIAELLTSSVVVVKADDPLSLAIDRMAAAHVGGLVVVEDKWPVGIFSQTEALISRDAAPDDQVQHWMDTRILSLPVGIPASRAAQQAIATGVRRILAVDGEQVRGVVSGLDFAELVKN